MKPFPTSIFLGDVALALHTLQPTGADAETTQAAIVRLLGFEWTGERTQASPKPEPIVENVPAKTEPTVQPPPRKAKLPAQAASALRAEPRWIPCTIETETTRVPPPSLATLFTAVEPLPLQPPSNGLARHSSRCSNRAGPAGSSPRCSPPVAMGTWTWSG